MVPASFVNQRYMVGSLCNADFGPAYRVSNRFFDATLVADESSLAPAVSTLGLVSSHTRYGRNR